MSENIETKSRSLWLFVFLAAVISFPSVRIHTSIVSSTDSIVTAVIFNIIGSMFFTPVPCETATVMFPYVPVPV